MFLLYSNKVLLNPQFKSLRQYVFKLTIYVKITVIFNNKLECPYNDLVILCKGSSNSLCHLYNVHIALMLL